MNPDFSTFLSNQKNPFYIRVRIAPNARKTEVFGQMDDRETWKIRVSATPEKGKANRELQKHFQKVYGVKITIISGETDRTKLLKGE